MQVIDYMRRQPLAWMQRVHADDAGIVGIARYLTNNPQDTKCFSAAERDDAFAVGWDVHLVYETTGGSVQFPPGGAAYFTSAQGVYDASQGIARLREVEAPAGTVCYFAVDVNIPGSDVAPYFNQVERLVPAAGYAPGAYGYAALCNWFRTQNRPTNKHLWQTYGQPGGPLDLWQDQQLSLGGVSVDINEASIRGWRKAVTLDPVYPTGRMGQSADLTLRVGEVGMLQAIYGYNTHPEGRAIVRKVKADSVGRRVIYVYPPVDPDADETMALGQEPCIFIVDVLP